MTSASSAIEYKHESLESLTQPGSLENNPIGRVFTFAPEVMELFNQAYPVKSGNAHRTEVITIRAIKPEYRKIIEFSPLTAREREVLQLIVEGCSNSIISERLHVTIGTVKTHVRNILGKFGVSDRTQAAVRALRAGLVH